jgi:hypothetical protein
MAEEFFHTLERYERKGLELFVEHAREYLKGQRTVPVSLSNDPAGSQQVMFTFSNGLLRRFVDDPDSVKKAYEVALKYGLRGYSNGGLNGIVLQRESDANMWDVTGRLAAKKRGEVMEDLDVDEKGLDALKKVKIVWHNPNGQRIVGVYDSKKGRVIFLDFTEY